MQSRIDIYVNKGNKPIFDQLKAIADLNELNFSLVLGLAASDYVRKINNEPSLLSSDKEWDMILKKSSPQELLKYNKLILRLNEKIAKRLCHT